MSGDVNRDLEPSTARELFAAELRRLRLRHGVSQEQLAALVVHSRALIAAVELGERWPPRDLAQRCDHVLHGGGILGRLWPLVDAERRAARQVLADVRLSDLRTAVLRLAALTGTDLSVLTVADSEELYRASDCRNQGQP
jgi:hypothetical protein